MRIFQLIRFPKHYQLEWYQEKCRIYLDEYEVEEISSSEFRNRKNCFMAKIFGSPYISKFPCIEFIKIFTEKESDEPLFDTSLLMKRFMVKE